MLIVQERMAGTRLIDISWAQYPNLMKILVALSLILMIQSDQKFACAMTAQLPWHKQNYGLICLIYCLYVVWYIFRDLIHKLIDSCEMGQHHGAMKSASEAIVGMDFIL